MRAKTDDYMAMIATVNLPRASLSGIVDLGSHRQGDQVKAGWSIAKVATRDAGHLDCCVQERQSCEVERLFGTLPLLPSRYSFSGRFPIAVVVYAASEYPTARNVVLPARISLLPLPQRMSPSRAQFSGVVDPGACCTKIRSICAICMFVCLYPSSLYLV